MKHRACRCLEFVEQIFRKAKWERKTTIFVIQQQARGSWLDERSSDAVSSLTLFGHCVVLSSRKEETRQYWLQNQPVGGPTGASFNYIFQNFLLEILTCV